MVGCLPQSRDAQLRHFGPARREEEVSRPDRRNLHLPGWQSVQACGRRDRRVSRWQVAPCGRGRRFPGLVSLSPRLTSTKTTKKKTNKPTTTRPTTNGTRMMKTRRGPPGPHQWELLAEAHAESAGNPRAQVHGQPHVARAEWDALIQADIEKKSAAELAKSGVPRQSLSELRQEFQEAHPTRRRKRAPRLIGEAHKELRSVNVRDWLAEPLAARWPHARLQPAQTPLRTPCRTRPCRRGRQWGPELFEHGVVDGA